MPIENSITAEKLWIDSLEIIKSKISIQSFNTWLKSTHGQTLDSETLLVSVPNRFTLNWIADKFHNMIVEAVEAAAGSSRHVEYVSREETAFATVKSPEQAANIKPHAQHIHFDTQLNSRYVFDSFVVGDSNQFAHAAAAAVAKAPMQTKYNPLYIYGGVGLGKTHLAQAIGNYVREQYNNLKILYVTSERFTSDFIDAIAHQRTAEFAKLYRGVDLLLLDDIQFLTGKEATQEQFFHTFNALHQAGKQIVLTSDRSPREIKGLEDRLLSRFQSGLVADIQPPDLETRIAILQQIIKSEKQTVSFDVLTYIARNITRNIRELEGSIVRLLAYGSMTGRDLNINFAQEILKDAFRTGTVISVESITKAVCDHFKIMPDQLKSKRKTADLVQARQIAMFLCRKHTSSSLKYIGEEFGGRDHSTVIHAVNVVENESQFDMNLKRAVEEVENSLKN